MLSCSTVRRFEQEMIRLINASDEQEGESGDQYASLRGKWKTRNESEEQTERKTVGRLQVKVTRRRKKKEEKGTNG